jgi:hypothetical protein
MSIALRIHQKIEDAPNYNHEKPEPKMLQLKGAEIVRNGTEGNNDTVDLVLYDKDGNKFIAMTTAALLRMVVTACSPHKE